MKDINYLNQADIEIWQRIQSHNLDKIGAKLTFTARLARENRWSMAKSKRVIEEYRRYCLLAVVMDHPVTPSEDVDQVWHLHLTYSRDYWQEFCPNVLGNDFHHGPTLGGKQESNKYHDWYTKTLHSYRLIFGEPPRDIWPEPDHRFAHADKNVHVNLAEVFIVSKKRVKQLAATIGLGATAVITNSVAAANESMFDNMFPLLLGVAAGLFVVLIVFAIAQSFKKKNQDGASGSSGGGCGGCSSSKGGDSGSGGDSGCGGGCGGCGG